MLIKVTQEEFEDSEDFTEDKLRLNLQKNADGLFECRGRIQGHYPLYLPQKSLLAEKIVMEAHKRTLHGGVSLSMAEVRREYWIPRLRQLTKRIRHKCHGCKRHRAIAFAEPPPGLIPKDRVEGTKTFEVIGVDYAGPLICQVNNNEEEKAYILLFSYSLSRAIHLELLPDQTTEGFIRSLKRFTARRGRPRKIYSDNAKTSLLQDGYTRL